MARAYPDMQSQEFSQSPGEWQALRGELVALLDQVETQVARHSRRDTGLGEKLREIRAQVGVAAPDDRHREALRSVKRAVDRFHDRDEAYAERPQPENPRDTLQSAIQQIRSRAVPPPIRSEAAPAPRQPAPRQREPRSYEPPRAYEAPRPVELPQVTELAHAVGGISHRLERLEGELRNQARTQTGNVKEIADQVGQLSHVVELLAGAVGETGQVKRLEGQIAALARLVTEGPQVDFTALTERLDDIAGTMGRLADLQVQASASARVADPSPSLVAGMRAIEDGVRNVYDRIDSIERQSAPPVDLEPITRELARITEAMQEASEPQTLVELVDLLNQRINDLESRSPAINELKLDVEELRSAVLGAMEPRFAALEMQLETLSDRLDERPQSDPSISQLEAQVRQLVNRMDQTGEQLTGLARLYQQPVAQPDFDALADLVASRTTDALDRFEGASRAPDYDEIERRIASAMRSHAPAPVAASEPTDYEEIEKRLARVMRAAAAEQPPAEDFSAMRSGISEVNARLSRLEESLTRRAEEARRIEAAPLAQFTPERPRTEPEPVRPAAPVPQPQMRKPDTMPASPAEDRPLTARPFGDPTGDPVRTALEARNGPRLHPGLAPDDEPVAVPAAAPARPPRPVSSFDTPMPAAKPVEIAEPLAAGHPADEPAPSANTFIQAHRRAARQGGAARLPVTPTADRAEPAAPAPASGPHSLIGRALARLQGSAPAAEAIPAVAPEAAAVAVDTVPLPDAPVEASGLKRLMGRAARPKAERAAKAEIPAETHVRKVEPPVAETAEPAAEIEDAVASESILTRYRRPILLAAVLVAASFLAANLVIQKFKESAPPPAAATEAPVEAEPPVADEPAAKVSLLTAPLPTAQAVDSLTTGAIDATTVSNAATQPMAFVPPLPQTPVTETTPVAAATKLAALDLPPVTPAAAPVKGPIKVEMPPETLGPEALRQAAADGDPRAQFEIAAIYTEGRVVHEDLAQAAIWYERSAAQGFAPAQYRLGNLYETGKGVEKDPQQARLWYQQAAEAGNRMAMHNLAALYAGGALGQQQFDAAAEWFEQAARRGMTDSQFNLGMLFARGLGVKQDMAASYKWFALAAARGDKDAAKARDDMARSLSAEDVQRLNSEVAGWMPEKIDIAANYAPLGTWSASFNPGETITRTEVVKSVQALLGQLGYDVGTPDGKAGPKTAEAIRAFERATGMSESGAINPRLLAVLGSQPV